MKEIQSAGNSLLLFFAIKMQSKNVLCTFCSLWLALSKRFHKYNFLSNSWKIDTDLVGSNESLSDLGTEPQFRFRDNWLL